jgi:hypothetical protein
MESEEHGQFEQIVTKFPLDTFRQCFLWCVSQLRVTHYCFHLFVCSIKIVQSCCTTLKNLLITKSGANFWNFYQTNCSSTGRLLNCLQPFTNMLGKQKVCGWIMLVVVAFNIVLLRFLMPAKSDVMSTQRCGCGFYWADVMGEFVVKW